MKHTSEAQEIARIEGVKRKLDRIYEPEEMIVEAFEAFSSNRMGVAWSGGRCSTDMLHMAREIHPKIKVFWCNHGVHYPKTIKYVRKIAKEWNLNLFEYKPKQTFWEVVEEYGFPDKGRRPRGQSKPKCCHILKMEPYQRFLEDENIEAMFNGMRVAEGISRGLGVIQKGSQHYYHKTDGVYKFYPILLWTTQEVIEYRRKNDIPKNPLYNDSDRSGCWPCTSYIYWEQDLMETNYRLYETLMRIRGGDKQRLLEHFEKTRVNPCQSRG